MKKISRIVGHGYTVLHGDTEYGTPRFNMRVILPMYRKKGHYNKFFHFKELLRYGLNN